jgi:OTU domain-containing protein 6
MGRKGGGRSAFMKKALRPNANERDSDEETENAEKTDGEEQQTGHDDASKPVQTEGTSDGKHLETKETSHLADDEGLADEGDDAACKMESRGQMVQRHKREAKAVKDKVKRMGKKGKEEGAKLLKEMEERHEKELESLEMGDGESDDQVQAVAASLYGTSINSPKKTKAQKKREQRLREEEEREARIAAENEARGESERETEEKALAEILQLENLELKDIPSDGHCLYKSLGMDIDAI